MVPHLVLSVRSAEAAKQIEAPTEVGASLSVLVIGRRHIILETGARQDRSGRAVQHFYYVTRTLNLENRSTLMQRRHRPSCHD
jgi:hypothetical protein